MTEENHMGWKLVTGVRREVINLFKLFANTSSVRYEDFARVWKEVKFSLIFNDRSLVIELLEFTEEIFQIVKEYTSSVYEFHTRVAALYTLYGLYFKQPIRAAAKIRFTKAEWQDLFGLIEESKSSKHYDVAFVFCKLYLNGAFSFVGTKRAVGLERGYRKYFDKRNALVSKACDVELLYRPLVSNQLVNCFMKLESLYCKKKSELLGKRNFNFIDGSFAESLQKELQEYALRAESFQAQKSRALTEIDSSTPEQGTSQTGSPPTKRDLPFRSTRSQVPKDLTENTKEDENGEELTAKRKKFGKKYLQLLAKKKAENYIETLKNSSSESCKQEALDLEELLKSEDYEF